MFKSRRSALLGAVAILAIGTPSTFTVHRPGHSQPRSYASASQWAIIGPVPNADTYTAPALTSVTFPGHAPTPLLLWTGPKTSSGYQISYASATNLTGNQWSPSAVVAGGSAITGSTPSVAPYGSATGQVIVAWKPENKAAEIEYSIGTTEGSSAVSWAPVLSIPGTANAGSPAIYSPFHSQAVFAVWKSATNDAIQFVIGFRTAQADQVQWGPVSVLPGAYTTDPPTVVEASTGSSSGNLYVLWNEPGTGQIAYAFTPDPLSPAPNWTGPVAFPAGFTTGTTPAGLPVGGSNNYPVLVIYRTSHGTILLDADLNQDGTVSPQGGLPMHSVYGAAQSVVVNPADPGNSINAAAAKDSSSPLIFVAIRHCPGCG